MKINHFTTFIFVLFFSSSFTQIVGGRQNSESTPKTISPSELTGGSFSGDVNTFTGNYSARIPLGAVSTPGGLSFELNHVYSPAFVTGSTMPVCSGIPFGEGWKLDLPQISIESDDYHKYLSSQECDETENDPNYHSRMNFGDQASTEGDLYWFSPSIYIPGVASGRAVFKYVDVDDAQCAVFSLNGFEHSLLIRFYGNSWTIITDNGIIYNFSIAVYSQHAPSNRRVLYYDESGLPLRTRVDSCTYFGTEKEAVRNAIQPKGSYNSWYCTTISSKNLPEQGILFSYNVFGIFNFFKEFSQPALAEASRLKFGTTTFTYTPDYTTYHDIMLSSVTSYGVGAEIDFLELNYGTQKDILNAVPELIHFDYTGAGRKDSLYSYQQLYNAGGDDAPAFSNWKRYQHLFSDGNPLTFPSSDNPYSDGSNYFRTLNQGGSNIPFSHSFLESNRLLTNENLVPGDIYEVKTKISRTNSGYDATFGNGTIDIKVVSGTLGTNPTNTTPSTYDSGTNGLFPESDFSAQSGVELFSTSNMAIKWSIPYLEHVVETSNYFTMPNIPSSFKGINIQVGPGNSDNQMNIGGLINSTEQPNGKNTYCYNFANSIKSGADLSHSFGVGLPWSMVAPIYSIIMEGEGGSGMYNFWGNDNPNSQGQYWANQPTKFNANTKLSHVELIRYSKNPYLLQNVRLYRMTGDHIDSGVVANLTGKTLISEKQMEYIYERNRLIENYDYNSGQAIILSNQYYQTKIYLSQVREIPTNIDTINNLPITDTSQLLTTFLGYSDYDYAATIKSDTTLLGAKTKVLTYFNDYLGGQTRIEYYPFLSKATNFSSRFKIPTYCNAVVPSRPFGMNEPFQVNPAVKSITKLDEKNFALDTNSNVGMKRWVYVYDTLHPLYHKTTLNVPTTHFRNSDQPGLSRGFKKTWVYEPILETGEQSYTVYEYYGPDPMANENMEDYLLYGKVKRVASYNSLNQIEKESLPEYAYSLAFPNGYTRPNPFKKGNFTYYNKLQDYEYRDLYLDQEVTYNKIEYDFDTQQYDTLVLTGVNAYPYLYPTSFGESDGYYYRPKFMGFSFYNDLAANNPDYMLHSYFVRKTKDKERIYENGLQKSNITIPIGVPIRNPVKNPFGPDIHWGHLVCDFQRDSLLFVAVQSDGTSARRDLLMDRSPVCDTMLGMMEHNPNWSADLKHAVYMQQPIISTLLWNVILNHYTQYTKEQLLRLIDRQPYISDEIQLLVISKQIKGLNSKVFDYFFTKNGYVSDTVLMTLLASNYTANKQRVKDVASAQPTLSQEALLILSQENYIAMSEEDKVNLLKNYPISDTVYKSMISVCSPSSVTNLIENSVSYPSDTILYQLLEDTANYIPYYERIFSASPRVFDTLMKQKIALIAGPIATPQSNRLDAYCNNTINTARTYIENVTEYEYYEADSVGKTDAQGYKTLMSIDLPMTVHFDSGTEVLDKIQLKHEPSWQLFSIKKSSPHLPGAFQKEEYFYYFDLQNRYDRLWFNFDENNTDISPETVNNYYFDNQFEQIPVSIHWTDPIIGQGGLGLSPEEIPPYQGMNATRDLFTNYRTLAFQKSTFSKNAREDAILQQSEYYHYTKRWEITGFGQDTTVYYDGPLCWDTLPPPPCNNLYECTPCQDEKSWGQYWSWNPLPFGWCLWSCGDSYLSHIRCPAAVDVTQWISFAETEECNDGIAEGGGETGRIFPGFTIGKTLALKAVYVQTDTLTEREFNMNKIDPKNTYVADFYYNPGILDSNGYATYKMLLPYKTNRVRIILERNRFLQPQLEQNATGLRTRYDYHQLIREWNVNNNAGSCYGLGNYMRNINAEDIGLPYRITVGCGLSDSLLTNYEYTALGQLKKVSSPSGKTMEYAFDAYNRLKKITENGTRVLSDFDYSYWKHNNNLNFFDRTQQNYVLSHLYSDADTLSAEIKKAFIDPLGRKQSVLSAVYSDNKLKHVHSNSVTYDNWGRAIKTYQPYYQLDTSSTLKATENYATPYTLSMYENTPKSRVVKAYDYGQSLLLTHPVHTQFNIANNAYAYCELGLSTNELEQIMSPGNTNYFKFFRTQTWDQDDKTSIEYTNAMGQKVAHLTYDNALNKMLTLFIYDSYGNLSRTINPNKQEHDYYFNILGQLYMEKSIDAGTVKNIYNQQGLLAATQDELARNHKDTLGNAMPYYRYFTYDSYGRPTQVERVYFNTHRDVFYFKDTFLLDDGTGSGDFYMDQNGQYDYVNYKFTNASTQDWMLSYQSIDLFPNSNAPVNSAIDLYGLPTDLTSSFSVIEKEMSYNFIGQLYDVTAYAEGKINILANSSAINNIAFPPAAAYNPATYRVTYAYDAQEKLASETIYFHPKSLDSAGVITSSIGYGYNYRGALTRKTVNFNGDGKTDAMYYYHYDPRGKLQQINGMFGASADSLSVPLVSYVYNDALGLLDTTLYYGTSFVADTLVRFYDDRLRLTRIKSKLMDYELYYDNQAPQPYNGFYAAQDNNYNGNINATRMQYKWSLTDMPSGAEMEDALVYGYKYDKANRIYHADALVGDYLNDLSYAYIHLNEQIGDAAYTYDKIGNITNLKRVLLATKDTTTLIADNMTYQYNSGTNRLGYVYNVGSPTRSFGYDVNGNLMTDSKKGITQTSYTRSHFPEKMTVNSEKITYLYDANDSRMYKNVDTTLEEYYLKDLGVLDMKTGNWSYYLSGTERFLRIEPDSVHQPKYNASIDSISISNGERFYYETDHLGNTRIVFSPRDVYFKYIHFASDFYPYGKILREYILGNQERYLTTQHERDQETGLDYRGARYYDASVGKFLGVDPLAQKFPEWSTYSFCFDNPLKFVDPDGRAPEGIYKDILTGETLGSDGVDDHKEYTISREDYEKVAPMSANRKEELTGMPSTKEIPTFYPASKLPSSLPKTDGKPCPNCLDTRTVGQNIFGLTYPGGNNPLSLNRQPNYSYVPTNLAEYPAIGHDRRYDNLGIKGASGLFLDTRAIGADWTFVAQELSIAGNPYVNPVHRLEAATLGIGLGLASEAKTLYQLSKPNGLFEILMWYKVSNVGVTNTPDPNK